MKRLNNKIALITGGSSGIGLATARLFSREGAHVIITGRDEGKLNEAAKGLQRVEPITCDSTSVVELDRLAARVKNSYGALDILFVNAGSLHIGLLEDVTEDTYDRIFDTNVKGTIFTIQKMLPLFKEGGVIVLCGAAIAEQGIRGLLLNSAAKAAIRSMARTLTAELKDRHIRVNVVSPGSIATPLLENSGISLEDAQEITENATVIPMGRPGTPEEVAAAVLFLTSDDSSFVTGINLAVDGGQAQI